MYDKHYNNNKMNSREDKRKSGRKFNIPRNNGNNNMNFNNHHNNNINHNKFKFNSAEVSSYLNKNWKEIKNMVDDASVPKEEKPVVYRNPEKAWSKGSTHAWASPKTGITSTGADFIAELKKLETKK
ncbi:hypothetical protein H8356DRAFT_1275929 [Neocallimastix lanati (nom. inval.)]|jgi:hypothetical protein|uniref:Uncharacterized protein n=1 Tax=Neocallimastix californiae TaxID=1754190 RepID=A0A1Y2F3S9_9FUNG|nr:hypothetical protein H8356DRAFT_1275929 [Neocallimastix sp. JGI-2020a]ORY78347.1 hypothetical protein LY90DRAFT_78905 [Neocallimastix californiae]|eukprot:ORY78347.1 hypothetical protein LY90DRAFT_78905 [Neocallimastix californiae]